MAAVVVGKHDKQLNVLVYFYVRTYVTNSSIRRSVLCLLNLAHSCECVKTYFSICSAFYYVKLILSE